MTIAESQIITLIELKKENSAIEKVRSLLPCEHIQLLFSSIYMWVNQNH